MTAEHVAVDRPLHPLHQMTTYELAGYRRNLESALSAGDAPARAQLQRRLDDVLEEQADRERIARANRP